jgi:hypothetical protein
MRELVRPDDGGDAPADPLLLMSGRERRGWRRAERRAVREHEAWQLATLRGLAVAGSRLTALAYLHSGGYAAAAEFTIGGKRIRAARVHRPALGALAAAIDSGPAIRLLAAGRYGPCWVLTFDLAAAPLAVLSDRLSILPGRPGGSTWAAVPAMPVGGRRLSAPSAQAD